MTSAYDAPMRRLLIAFTLLAACGGSKPAPAPPPPAPPPPAPAPAPAPEPAPAPAPVAAGGAWVDVAADSGIPACDDFIRSFNTFMHCDKVPADARSSAKEGVQQMSEGFKKLQDPSVPPDAKQQAADACKQAQDAIKQSATQLGCPAP